jgi:hypothetical protein
VEIRFGRYTVKVGPLLSTVIDRAGWAGKDGFPAWQFFADEIERVLSFAAARGMFEMYLPELTGRTPSQRDSALAELRVAYFLDRNGFTISEWRPVGLAPKEGEFLARCPSGAEVFVEVKSPGWESELTQEQRLSGRLAEPKYINGEARYADNSPAITFAVEKAYPKFSPVRHNLLVVADDLFLSMEYYPSMWARRALYDSPDGKFATPAFERLGGVGLFWVKQQREQIWYEMPLFLNPFATEPTQLPDEFALAFHGRILTA